MDGQPLCPLLEAMPCIQTKRADLQNQAVFYEDNHIYKIIMLKHLAAMLLELVVGSSIEDWKNYWKADPPMVGAREVDDLFRATAVTDRLKSLTLLLSDAKARTPVEAWTDQVKRLQVNRVDNTAFSTLIEGIHRSMIQLDAINFGNGHTDNYNEVLSDTRLSLLLDSSKKGWCKAEFDMTTVLGTPGHGLSTALLDPGRDLDHATMGGANVANFLVLCPKLEKLAVFDYAMPGEVPSDVDAKLFHCYRKIGETHRPWKRESTLKIHRHRV
ncbi:hypothetical protein BGZ74_004673 [Mortierella antarctica]|nr:hypothetical protein BGZ74_004673 [Mortierella antarctica]